jgi:hypothetical protein
VGDLDGVGDADTRRGSTSVAWRRSALQQRSTDTTLGDIAVGPGWWLLTVLDFA